MATKKQINKTIEYLSLQDDVRLDKKVRALKQRDWILFLLLYPSEKRLEAYFKYIHPLLTDRQVIKMFADVWTNSDLVYQSITECKSIFRTYGRTLMNNSEKKEFKNLPQKLKIYRGIRVPTLIDHGISWTLSKECAEKFMNMIRYSYLEELLSGEALPPELHLLEKEITKDEVICYFNRRNESEIIYIDDKNSKCLKRL